MGQLHHRGDIDVQLLLQQRQVGRPELTGGAEAGVVHQNPHPGREPVGHLGAVGRVGEVGGKHLDACARLVVQFRGEPLEPRHIAGDEHQVITVDRVPAGEPGAKPGGGSGDQGNGA